MSAPCDPHGCAAAVTPAADRLRRPATSALWLLGILRTRRRPPTASRTRSRGLTAAMRSFPQAATESPRGRPREFPGVATTPSPCMAVAVPACRGPDPPIGDRSLRRRSDCFARHPASIPPADCLSGGSSFPYHGAAPDNPNIRFGLPHPRHRPRPPQMGLPAASGCGTNPGTEAPPQMVTSPVSSDSLRRPGDDRPRGR